MNNELFLQFSPVIRDMSEAEIHEETLNPRRLLLDQGAGGGRSLKSLRRHGGAKQGLCSRGFAGPRHDASGHVAAGDGNYAKCRSFHEWP